MSKKSSKAWTETLISWLLLMIKCCRLSKPERSLGPSMVKRLPRYTKPNKTIQYFISVATFASLFRTAMILEHNYCSGSPSRCRERKLSRSPKAIGRIRWMVFLDRVKSTKPLMLTKSLAPTSVMKLSASRSSTVRRSTCGGTNRRPLSAQSVLSDSERFRHTQWKGQAETTPHVSPAPIRDGNRQHVTRVSQWNAGKGTAPRMVLFVALGQAQWARRDEEGKDETRRGRRSERERMNGGRREGEVEGSALGSGWVCEWGWCFCLQGLRGGGTGMVERLAIHRPGERGGEKKSKIGWSVLFLGQTLFSVCFLSSTYSG